MFILLLIRLFYANKDQPDNDKHEHDWYTIKVPIMFSLSSIPDNVGKSLCNLHMMDLRVTQTTVLVVLLDQSGSHLCGTTQCDSYVVPDGNGKLE